MITIITIAYGGMEPVWDIAEKTWRPYCDRHGYVLKVLRSLPVPSLHPSWNKVKAVLDEISCATGPVWCMDSDMTVANQGVPLETSALAEKPVWFSTDWNGLCAGLFRITPGVWQEWFLSTAIFCKDVRNPDEFGKGLGCKWEQNAFKTLVSKFPSISEKVGLLDKSLVCDRPPDPKAVIYHFGGRSNEERIRLIKSIHNL